MVLAAAGELVKIGVRLPQSETRQVFASLSGGMLLSFCAVESFMNSVAFKMQTDPRYRAFDYARYLKKRNFWDRMKAECTALEIDIALDAEPLRTIEQMRQWRVSLVHFEPTSIPETAIQDTREVHALSAKFHDRTFAVHVNVENAKKFYGGALQTIELIEKKSGITPSASVTYNLP